MPRSGPALTQSGNVLFLILIAVALFAALSYAVTSSTRSGGGSTTKEQASLSRGEIENFFAAVDTSVTRLRLSSGFPAEQISLAYNKPLYNGTTHTNALANPRCLSTACQVFHPSGGGVAAKTFATSAVKDPPGWNATWGAPGALDLILVQWPDAGTSKNDVVMYINAVKPEICAEFDRVYSTASNVATGGTWNTNWDSNDWDNPGVTLTNGTSVANKLFFSTYDASMTYCTLFRLVLPR